MGRAESLSRGSHRFIIVCLKFSCRHDSEINRTGGSLGLFQSYQAISPVHEHCEVSIYGLVCVVRWEFHLTSRNLRISTLGP